MVALLTLDAISAGCPKLLRDAADSTNRSIGVDGNPILRDGFSGWRKSEMDGVEYTSWLDLEGRDVRYKTTNEWWTSAYDVSGRLIRKTYCNELWVPTPRADGVLFETKGYDADGNETDWEFFGVSSNRVNCSEGVAVVRCRFNRRGLETRRRFYGADGKPVAHKDGYAGYDIVYDKKGNFRVATYLDCKGKQVVTAHGYAKEERKYNALDLEIERAWYNEHGKLVCVNGVAKTVSAYDDNGNKTAEEFYGADNRLTRNAFNYAAVKMTYDGAGQMNVVAMARTESPRKTPMALPHGRRFLMRLGELLVVGIMT